MSLARFSAGPYADVVVPVTLTLVAIMFAAGLVWAWTHVE